MCTVMIVIYFSPFLELFMCMGSQPFSSSWRLIIIWIWVSSEVTLPHIETSHIIYYRELLGVYYCYVK